MVNKWWSPKIYSTRANRRQNVRFCGQNYSLTLSYSNKSSVLSSTVAWNQMQISPMAIQLHFGINWKLLLFIQTNEIVALRCSVFAAHPFHDTYSNTWLFLLLSNINLYFSVSQHFSSLRTFSSLNSIANDMNAMNLFFLFLFSRLNWNWK